MRPNLVAIQVSSSLQKYLLKLSSDALPSLVREDSKGEDFAFSKVFALPLNGRAIGIRSNILEHETQKTHNRRAVLCNQNVRTGMPLSSEAKPIQLVEFGDKSQ
jgi:hypothetical protein